MAATGKSSKTPPPSHSAATEKTSGHFPEFEAKMRTAGTSEAAIQAFRFNYGNLTAGGTGLIPEESIEPVRDLPRFEGITGGIGTACKLLAQTVVVKLI